MPRTIASWLCLVVLVGGCETARRAGAMDDGRALPDLDAAAAASHEDLARASETARDGATHSEEVAPCTAGVLATGEIPWGIAVHGDRVYWIERGHNLNPGGGKVMAVDKSGANLDVLATGDPGWAIDVDDDQVYWNIAQWEGAVMKRSLAGGAPVEIAMEGNSAFDLAVDPTGLYWGHSLMGRLIKAPHGGTPIVLDPGTEGGSLRALTLDSTHVYYTTDDQILRVPKSGGTVTPLYSTTLPRLWGIAVDETSIYFSTFGDPGGIWKMPRDGGTATEIVPDQSLVPYLVIDSAHVYWSEGTGTIRRADLDGQNVVTLASGYDGIFELAIDDACVYFTARRIASGKTTGYVVNVPK